MSELTAEEKLNKYAKESKNIEYSTKIFETTEEVEKPKMVLRELTKEENRVWTIILKYKTLGNIPQEVIMGTLGDTNERKKKAIEIINLIRGQLEENVTSETGYEHYGKLSQYVQSEKIPFRLTTEGTDILASKSQERKSITRTCFENERGKIESRFAKEDLEKMKSERKNELIEYINKKKEIKKWEERREKILKSIEPEEKQKFLKGEKITEFIKETEDNITKQKNIALDYLLYEFEEENSGQENKAKLLKGYLQIKEKGFSIDTKIVLENLADRYYNEIRKKGGNPNLEELDKINLIEEHEKFFDLVKEGRDWNARLNFMLKLNDFNYLRNIFENCKDTELLKYFDLKEKMIKETKLDEIKVNFNKYDSVKELNEFLINSSARQMTKNEEQNFISQIYTHVIRLICESNYDEIELYNKYAEKSNIPVCQLPLKRQISQEQYISNIVEKICENIVVEESEKTKNEDKQNQNSPEQLEER